MSLEVVFLEVTPGVNYPDTGGEGLPECRLRRSAMRNRLRITGPGKDLLIETHWYFRTYDLARTRRLVRRAGMRVVEVFDFDYHVDVPRKRGESRLDSIFVLQPVTSPA